MAKRRGFDFYYKLCEDYYKQNGNLKVPEHYDVEVDGETIKFGMWIANRRRRKETMSQSDIDKLDKLGMNWKVKSWNSFYEILKDYMKDHDIRDIRQVDTYKGTSLGQWVYLQRIRYNANSLSKEKIKLLNDIGFVWDIYTNIKNENKLNLLKEYLKENGHLLIQVNEVYKGEKLGKYVARLRNLYKDNLLSEDVIKQLEDMGFSWSGNEGFWEHCYNLCIECAKMGESITPNKIYKGFKIGSWLHRQKVAISKGTLSEDRKALVDEIIAINPSSAWKRSFLLAKEYYDNNNNLEIETDGKNEELARWLEYQKLLYKRNKLSAKKIKDLESLDIDW